MSRQNCFSDTSAMKETRITRYQSQFQDNRDSEQMYDYLESRVTVLKKRIFELEMENAALRCQLQDLQSASSMNEYVETYA
jgi:hypothetical protein